MKKQSAVSSQQSAIGSGNSELGIGDEKRNTSYRQPTTDHQKPATDNRLPTTSGYYVDTRGQLKFKPIKLGSKHPYYYIMNNDVLIYKALQKSYDRAEMNIIKFFEKIFG
jgi:hypothetical protein